MAERTRKVSKEELSDLYWKKGLTQREIAPKFGVCKVTVIRWMKKYGIPVRNPRWSKEEEDFLINNYAILTQKENAEKLGRTWRAVHSHAFKVLGINKRKVILEADTARIKKLIKKLTPEETGYLAGLIDGEGSITVQIHSNLNGLCVTPKISISNTNLEIINWVKKTRLFKTNSYFDPRFLKSKVIYQCETHGYRVLSVLDAIGPHLIGKKEHAKLLSSFIRLRLSHKRSKHFTKEEIEKLRRLILLNSGSKNALTKLAYYERRWLHD